MTKSTQRRTRTATLFLAAALLTAGCGDTPAPAASEGGDAAKTPTAQPGGVAAQGTPATPVAPAGGSGTASPSGPAGSGEAAAPPRAAGEGASAAAPPADGKPANTAPAAPAAEAKKLYKMNPKTYDIVPIDPATADKKVVLLTFDDGPKELELNQKLLDILDKHQAKAIFFMNGYRIKQKPDLVKLVASRGMAIGNHAWDHDDLSKQSKDKLPHQIGDVSTLIQELIGATPQFFRPPYGSGNAEVRALAKEGGMLYMTWSNGSKDWEMTTKNNHPEQVIQNVLEQLRAGSNILMHELPWTAAALDELLTQLEGRGYRFVDPASIDTTL